jgi:hypothetical protein
MAFFYCSKSESQGTSPLEVLRSFVAQLALSPDGLSVGESVKRLIERPMSSELSLEQCLKQLVALVAPHRRVTLVVGTLDECENYREPLPFKWLTPGANHLLRHYVLVYHPTESSGKCGG